MRREGSIANVGVWKPTRRTTHEMRLPRGLIGDRVESPDIAPTTIHARVERREVDIRSVVVLKEVIPSRRLCVIPAVEKVRDLRGIIGAKVVEKLQSREGVLGGRIGTIGVVEGCCGILHTRFMVKHWILLIVRLLRASLVSLGTWVVVHRGSYRRNECDRRRLRGRQALVCLLRTIDGHCWLDGWWRRHCESMGSGYVIGIVRTLSIERYGRGCLISQARRIERRDSRIGWLRSRRLGTST